MRRLALALLLASAVPAYAETGQRRVTYKEGAITTICGQIGNAVAIKLPRGWKATDGMTGDALAWGMSLMAGGNVIGLKPAAEAFSTNLIVAASNGRLLNFKLRQCPIAYQTIIELPSEKPKPAAPAQNPTNRAYTWTKGGAEALKPIEAWDDGRFTYLRFAPAQPIPAVYGMAPDGKTEVSLNWQLVEPRVIAVQTVARRLILRSGQAVGCVWNEGYGR